MTSAIWWIDSLFESAKMRPLSFTACLKCNRFGKPFEGNGQNDMMHPLLFWSHLGSVYGSPVEKELRELVWPYLVVLEDFFFWQDGHNKPIHPNTCSPLMSSVGSSRFRHSLLITCQKAPLLPSILNGVTWCSCCLLGYKHHISQESLGGTEVIRRIRWVETEFKCHCRINCKCLKNLLLATWL